MNILVDGQTFLSPEINRGIGVYLKNTLNNMVKQSFEHNWYIAVGNKSAIKVLDEWVQDRVIVIENDLFIPSTDYAKGEQYSESLEQIIRENDIDVYWNPNPLMVNVLFPTKKLPCKFFVTMYDLIPLIMPIDSWPDSVKREYNRRLEYIKSNELTLLCISEATKNDVQKYLSSDIKCVVTFLAADSKLFYKKCIRDEINEKPVVIFTGGFDYRKNITGAVNALISAKKKYADDAYLKKIKLYIVCKYQPEDKLRLETMLENTGCKNDIVLTGYIPDKELAELYQSADLFFFPSLYEGFGLPILEAMLAGCYVISADNSSLPEVCGEHALLFDANDIDNMADTLYEAVQNVAKESAAEKQMRQQYALSFSWEKTAEETLNSFYDLRNEEIKEKKKLAIVTPWPNQRTGIANYEYMLVPYLAKYFDVDIFVDDTFDDGEQILPNEYGAQYRLKELDLYHSKYDEIVYQIGNNAEYHAGIYEMMLKYPGIAEIHDFILHPFFYHAFYLRHKENIYKDALQAGYKEAGEKHFAMIKNGGQYPDIDAYPMCESVIEKSKATIFHNHWSRKQVEKYKNIYSIPLASFKEESIEESTALYIKKEDNQIMIGCFGYLNENKRPMVILSAIKTLIEKGYNLKLVFGGKCNIPDFDKHIPNELKEHILISGYLSHEKYFEALNMTDIVINLRYPSMGESSATLCEAFRYGKPVLVSDVNQYKEFPDEVCWKVPVNQYEEIVLTELLRYLIENPEVREAMGNNAKAYAENVLSPEKIAYQYYQIINKIGDKI